MNVTVPMSLGDGSAPLRITAPTAQASEEQGEGVIFECHARHDFLLKGLAERLSNLKIEVGENGRFFDRAGGVLLEQAAALERRLKIVEAGLIELQLFELERHQRIQRIISAQHDRYIEQLQREVKDLRREGEERAALEAPRPRKGPEPSRWRPPSHE